MPIDNNLSADTSGTAPATHARMARRPGPALAQSPVLTFLTIIETTGEIDGIQKSRSMPSRPRPGIIAVQVDDGVFGAGIFKDSEAHYRYNKAGGETIGRAEDLISKVAWTSEEKSKIT